MAEKDGVGPEQQQFAADFIIMSERLSQLVSELCGLFVASKKKEDTKMVELA